MIRLLMGPRAGFTRSPVSAPPIDKDGETGHYPGAVSMNPVDQGFLDYQVRHLAGLTAVYDPVSCR